jgi:serine/threonine-protein kinase RsbW
MEQQFKRDLRSLTEIFEFIDAFVTSERSPLRVRTSLYFAIEELFTNMVKYHGGTSNDVSIRLNMEQDKVVVQLIDHDVEEFDVTRSPSPNLTGSLDERKPGGLGLYLTQRIVDSMEYEYKDRESITTFTINLGRSHA